MRYTKATRDILYFIDQYGFITINICSKLFYKDKKKAYEQARVKLKTMQENDLIQKYIKQGSREFVYQVKKNKINECKYILLNMYAEFNLLSKEILFFKAEHTFKDRRPDGHIIFKNYNNEIRSYFIEVERFNRLFKHKYIEMFENKYVQEWYKINQGEEYFPDVIIVNPIGISSIKDTENFNYYCINYDLDGLEKLL